MSGLGVTISAPRASQVEKINAILQPPGAEEGQPVKINMLGLVAIGFDLLLDIRELLLAQTQLTAQMLGMQSQNRVGRLDLPPGAKLR